MKTLAEWLARKPAGPKPRKPLKRSRKPIQRRTRPRPISAARRRQRAAYRPQEAAYLKAHPFCQIAIAALGFDEEAVLRHAKGLDATNCQGIFYEGQFIPVATEVHHRNKGRGARLNDERWWMSASRKWHDKVEAHKTSWARPEGYLLPFEADAEGRRPDGTVALTTPELMRKKACSGGSPPPY